MRVACVTLAIIASGLFVAGQSSQAQSQSQSQNSHHQITNGPAKRLSSMLQVIDSVSTIIPGQGFRSIGLGDSMDRLQKLWGAPFSTDKRGKVLYRLDPKTLIQFTGKESIESIVVSGSSGSVARINNGVEFGMRHGQVLSQFASKPNQISNKAVQYSHLGIELNFVARKLAKIMIFPPINP